MANKTIPAIQTNEGKVGIGTTNPSYKIQVSGDAYITDTLKNGKVETRSFQVDFPNALANRAIDIRFPNTYINGLIEIEVTSGFSYQNSVGVVKKIFSVGANPNNVIWNTTVARVVEAHGVAPDNWTIGDFAWDATNSKYIIPVYHIVSTGNVLNISIRYFSEGAIDHPNLPTTTVSALYTATIPAAYQTKHYVYYNDNVGIGTSNPGAKLDVNGEVYISPNTAGKNTFILSTNASNDASLLMRSDVTTKVNIQANGLSYFNGGNVGIGITNPSSKLHIDDASTPYITISRAGVPTWQLRNNFPNNQYGFSFNNTTAGTVPLFIGAGGNIGIGLDSPAAKLDIASTQGDGIVMRYDTSTAYQAWIRPYWNSSTDSRIDFAINRTANVTPAVIMSVGYNGNVGIKTSSPSAALEVSGSVIIGSPTLGESYGHSLRMPFRADNLTDGTLRAHLQFDSIEDYSVNGGDAWKWKLGAVARPGSAGNYNSQFEILRTTRVGVTDNPDFVINRDGNIGIGMRSPTNKIQISGGGISFTTSTGLAVQMIGIVLPTNIGYIGPYNSPADGNSPTVVALNHAASVQQTWFYSSGRIAMSLNREGRFHIGNLNNAPNCLLSVGPTSATTAVSGMCFGNDASANLYRSSASAIKTDGQLVAVGGFYSLATAGNYIETLNIGTAVIIEGGATEGLYLGDSSRWLIGTSDAAYTANADGDLHFRDNTNSVTRMIINYASGFVGIGTVGPVANLEVAGASETVGTIRINGGKVNILAEGEINSSLEFAQRDASVVGLVAGKIASISEFSNGAFAGLGFYTAQQSRVPELKEAVRIKYDGTVGIGTTSPYEKLDVRGGILRTNTRVSNTQLYPLGHYSAGEPIFEIDPSWSEVELQRYFNSSNVTWVAVADAPGGYCIYINGAVEVGAFNGSGFPYIPVDTDDIFYMECWIQNVGLNQTHYMGSQDLDHNFSNLGGNPGSYGYFVMVNSNPTTTWTKFSGYIGGFSATVTGKFEIGTKYWSPMALFNYTAGTGTRACRISGWKVIKVYQPGNRYFSGSIGIGTTSPNTLLNVHGADPFVRINNTSANDQGIKISYNNSDTHGLHLLYNANSAVSCIDNTYPVLSTFVYGDIYFRQNVAGTMTTRMTIKGDGGNVGIGTTSPTQKLDIVGSYGAPDDNAGILKIKGPGVGPTQLNFGISGDGGYAWIQATNISIDNDRDIILGPLGGNIGIGTTSPLQKLHVLGNISTIAQASAGNETNRFQFYNIGAATYDIASIRAFVGAGQANRGELGFYVNNGSSQQLAMYIDRSQNVGIGITNPTQKLDIVGSYGAPDDDGGILKIRGAGVGPTQLNFGVSADGGYGWIQTTDVGASNERNIILNPLDGNVGIGTVTTLSLLTVGPVSSTTAANGITLGGDAVTNLYRAGSSAIRTDGALIVGSYLRSLSYIQLLTNIYADSYTDTLNINVGNTAANDWQTAIKIKPGSYVGIGTTNPTGKLHVVSSVAGETVLRTDGTNGTLFSVVDDLSDSLMSVNNSAGLPVLEVFADDRVVAGQYGSGDFVLINNKVGLGTSNPTNKLTVIGAASIGSSTYNIAAPSNGLIVQGNVGIGTTSPQVKLHVLNSAVGGTYYGQLTVEDNGEAAIQIKGVNYSSIYFSDAANPYEAGIVYNHSLNTLELRGGGNTADLSITSAGNVGIGITNPSSLLHLAGVGGDGVPFLRIAGTASDAFNWGSSTIYANLTANETAINIIGKAQTQYNSSYIGYRHVADGSASNMLTLGLYAADFLVNILGNGNVGIGLTNPAYKLQLTGGDVSIAGANVLRFGTVAVLNTAGNADNIYANIRVIRNESTVNQDGMYVNYDSNGGAAAHLRFYANAGNERMRIDASNGHVGIGTQTPSGRLHVNTASYSSLNKPLVVNNGVQNLNTKLYDTAVIQQDDVTTLRLVERNAAVANQILSFSIGDGFARIACTAEPMQFYVNGGDAVGDYGYLGLNGTKAIEISTTANVGIGNVTPSAARLHIKGDGSNPVLRVETALLVAGTTTASKTFVGWMPMQTGALSPGDTVFIPLFK